MGYASGHPQILRDGEKIDGAIKYIRADLTSRPTEVTVEDLIKKMKKRHRLNDRAAYIMFVRDALQELSGDFPNGLKVIA